MSLVVGAHDGQLVCKVANWYVRCLFGCITGTYRTGGWP